MKLNVIISLIKANSVDEAKNLITKTIKLP